MTETAVIQQPAMGNEQAPAMDAKTSQNTTSQVETVSPEEFKKMQDALHAANKEAEKTRLKLKGYEDKEEATRQAQMSEIDKANLAKDQAIQKAKEIEDRANQKLIKAEVLSKAAKFIDADVVLALLDKSKLTVKEDGSIDGVDTALDELAKAKPHLLKTSQGSPLGATNPGAGATNETAQQRKDRIFGSSKNPFDPSFVLNQGGGAINNGE